ncbi:MAG: hypothetical protein CME63_04995 [Halobacteriovoraceae bacterium]|nr:hypothetical protein [Halobacteriovoraceae bacterium]MBC97082.1 hypothetical protein [Halobacteriovoraceae bacterium]|tara:strand:+ start:76667 stop:77212 length:546 start_codon:yes stop_codon:yes gene_type:complete
MGNVMKLLLTSILFFLGLNSCSQLDKKDCSQIDWFELGKKDGSVGRRSTMFLQHSLKCSKLPESKEYHNGRKEGLIDFCTLEGGIDYGLSGALYIGQCDEFKQKSLKSFKVGLEKGRLIYRQNELIAELNQNLKDVTYELSTSFHSKEETRDLEIHKQSLMEELKSERQYLDQLIRALPPR